MFRSHFLRNKSSLLIGLIVISLSCQNNVSSEKLAGIVENYGNAELLNGSVLIAEGDSIFYQGSFGIKNLAKKERNKPNTIFPLASVTKQFTSAAILLLNEQKRLSLEDPIGKYLDVPEIMMNIPIMHLMHHTSGIPDYIPNDIPNNREAIFEFLAGKKLSFQPNTKFQYCNTGYFLLGEIVQQVSAMDFGDFLYTQIFKPLGMNNTMLYTGSFIDRSIGYTKDWKEEEYILTSGDGGIISTVEDIYRWNMALLNNSLLSQQSSELMFSSGHLEDGSSINYGLGWIIDKNNENIVSHTGGMSSFAAYNQIDLESGRMIIILSNQIRPELMSLVTSLKKALD